MFSRCVTGHRKRQFELHRRQTNSLSFSKFIDPRSTYNNMTHSRPHRCIQGGYGGLQSYNYGKNLQQTISRARGHPPLANGREALQAQEPLEDAPSSLEQSYMILRKKKHIQNKVQKLQSYKQLRNNKKSLRARGDPLRPPEESHSKSRSRQGPPELYYTNSIQTTSNAQGEICYKLQIKFYKVAFTNK